MRGFLGTPSELSDKVRRENIRFENCMEIEKRNSERQHILELARILLFNEEAKESLIKTDSPTTRRKSWLDQESLRQERLLQVIERSMSEWEERRLEETNTNNSLLKYHALSDEACANTNFLPNIPNLKGGQRKRRKKRLPKKTQQDKERDLISTPDSILQFPSIDAGSENRGQSHGLRNAKHEASVLHLPSIDSIKKREDDSKTSKSFAVRLPCLSEGNNPPSLTNRFNEVDKKDKYS